MLKVRALEGRVGPLCASQGDPGVSKRVAGRMWTLSCSPGAAGVGQTSMRPKLWVPTVTPTPQVILGGGRETTWASQGALVVKNLPATQETQEMRVGSPGQEDPLEEEMEGGRLNEDGWVAATAQQALPLPIVDADTLPAAMVPKCS